VPRDCFLEGPSFDRDGNLHVVNIPYGQVLRVSPAGEFTPVATWDGEPNGLKIHRDGRIFTSDHKQGLMVLDPRTSTVAPFLDRPRRERFTERPPFRAQRRPVFHRPGRGRPARPERTAMAIACQWHARTAARQRAEPQRAGC
jgi:hypothetical protein